jgi:hypothetical protein
MRFPTTKIDQQTTHHENPVRRLKSFIQVKKEQIFFFFFFCTSTNKLPLQHPHWHSKAQLPT